MLLTAGQEVSNALYDYQAASDKITIRSKQIHYLEKSVGFTKELMKYNANTNYTDVLTSEQNLLSSQLNSIDDKLQQLQAVVTLYASLGGGWRQACGHGCGANPCRGGYSGFRGSVFVFS